MQVFLPTNIVWSSLLNSQKHKFKQRPWEQQEKLGDFIWESCITYWVPSRGSHFHTLWLIKSKPLSNPVERLRSLRPAQIQPSQILTQTLDLTSIAPLASVYFILNSDVCFLWHHFLFLCFPTLYLQRASTKEWWDKTPGREKGWEAMLLLNGWDMPNLKTQRVRKVKTTDQIWEMLWLSHSWSLRWHQENDIEPSASRRWLLVEIKGKSLWKTTNNGAPWRH